MRSRYVIVAMLVSLVTLLAGCEGKPSNAAGTPASKTTGRSMVLMLKYQESEPGVDPYVTRVLISPRFVRFDDDKDDSDYVLFDRKLRTIYSVGHDNRAILVVHDRRITEVSPVVLKPGIDTSIDKAAPRIGGHQTRRVRLLVNGKVCRRMYVVPGMLPEAVQALKEFRRVLAGKLAANISKTPVGLQDPCFLQDEVFTSQRKLQYGLPIQEWKNNDSTRLLVDYNEQYPVLDSLFTLPPGYRRYTVGKQGMRDEPTS